MPILRIASNFRESSVHFEEDYIHYAMGRVVVRVRDRRRNGHTGVCIEDDPVVVLVQKISKYMYQVKSCGRLLGELSDKCDLVSTIYILD